MASMFVSLPQTVEVLGQVRLVGGYVNFTYTTKMKLFKNMIPRDAADGCWCMKSSLLL